MKYDPKQIGNVTLDLETVEVSRHEGGDGEKIPVTVLKDEGGRATHILVPITDAVEATDKLVLSAFAAFEDPEPTPPAGGVVDPTAAADLSRHE